MEAEFPELANFDADELYWRYLVLRRFNEHVRAVLPVVDFQQATQVGSVVQLVCKRRALVFGEVKEALFEKALASTKAGSGSGPTVRINRPQARRARERQDPDLLKSVFGQVYRQLHPMRPVFLRRGSGRSPFEVEYLGEGGQDAGGLFRDCISHLCSDLMSDSLPLFVPVPNASGFGENQDAWVPNPSATSSLHLSMFRFVGKLMGLAIRRKLTLNLDLPPLVWKFLVSSPLTIQDLQGIDQPFATQLQKMRLSLEQSDFQYTFVVPTADGRRVSLIKDGEQVPVSIENVEQYIALALEYRLHEFDLALSEVAQGMSAVVPVPFFNLFRWSELELLVCGRRDVDLDLLRSQLKLEGYRASDKQIRWLFESLAQYSNAEREAFLRFVWGRSRLPLKAEDFAQQFKVVKMHHSPPDQMLPEAHTCFFTLDLPQYSSQKVLSRRLKYAILNCRAIDTDHDVGNFSWE